MGIESFGYVAAAVLFFGLSLLVMASRHSRPLKTSFALAAIASSIWAAAVADHAALNNPQLLIQLLEPVRDLTWVTFLFAVLKLSCQPSDRAVARLNRIYTWIAAFTAGLMLLTLYRHAGGTSLSKMVDISLYSGHVLMAAGILALLEQLYRNSRRELRRGIKYLCLGIGGMFAFDFLLYADALLFNQIAAALWEARGFVHAMVVPVIGVAVTRNLEWRDGTDQRPANAFGSRRLVFHTAALLAAGLYLLIMGTGGYYVRVYGGEWGAVAQTAFLLGSGLLLAVLLFSAQLRAWLKVIISKQFFDYKYDYRDEWLRFIRTLFSGEPDIHLRERAIQAIAQIVDSPGGLLWWRDDHGRHYDLVARWNMDNAAPRVDVSDNDLVRLLEEREWVINLDEQHDNPKLRSTFKGLKLPEWLHAMPNAWLVVPLILHERLFGFVVLAHSHIAPINRHFNWEDCDLLKTAGRQAASHLAQLEASRALAEARQFETFNRLSAFVVHDLKNLIAQLSLVVSNSAKHKHNPLFMDDVIRTVGNSVDRMNRLLAQLRADHSEAGQTAWVDLAQLLAEVVKAHPADRPSPALELQKRGIYVNANRDRLAAVIGHVIQNARDATPADGKITVRMRADDKYALVEVEDTGIGMDETFIHENLFRPFKTTKGNGGMGIGTYETREFVRSLGGDVDVVSRPGQGSIFRLQLPSTDARHHTITDKTGNG